MKTPNSDTILKLEKRVQGSFMNSFHKCFGTVIMCQALFSAAGLCEEKQKEKQLVALDLIFESHTYSMKYTKNNTEMQNANSPGNTKQ